MHSITVRHIKRLAFHHASLPDLSPPSTETGLHIASMIFLGQISISSSHAILRTLLPHYEQAAPPRGKVPNKILFLILLLGTQSWIT